MNTVQEFKIKLDIVHRISFRMARTIDYKKACHIADKFSMSDLVRILLAI